MYGLLLENLAAFIRIQWGEGKWDSVRRSAGIDAPSFSIHHVYAETLLGRLARSSTSALGVGEKEFFEAMGVYFVEFVGQYGYDEIMSVLGRYLRDFLNGLDNLHEYLKFSYPKMRAPSFYCDSETERGLRLHYRSKRRGFVHYTMGQIKQVARHFYDQDCQISILEEKLDGETMHVIFDLEFDNAAFVEAASLKSMIRREQQLPIRASIIFELFPFCVVFSPTMEITYCGHAMLTILKELIGQTMTEAFEIVRPLIAFSYNAILERRNNVFELVTVAPIKDDDAIMGSIDIDDDDQGTSLKLRGQMLPMDEWGMIIFLATPVLPDIDTLVQTGLYINDLSLHDCSRDLVLAGTQQSVELKLALDQEQQKSRKLEESMKKLDEEMKRTDELLYQMIPKQVADRIRQGESPVDTCEVFESVSILFSDVVTFTAICSRITPLDVVKMLNQMYSLFDQLTERNGVYKVETIGDAYMVVSGAPVYEANHADRICDMALDMLDAITAIKDPSGETEHLSLRVGCHSGMVVAGVVGVKMPRYCLFGDTVNTSSRMESTSAANKVQISESTMELLSSPYKYEQRGTVPVKGKGEMNTYWLLGREARLTLHECKTFNWNVYQDLTKKKPPPPPAAEEPSGRKDVGVKRQNTQKGADPSIRSAKSGVMEALGGKKLTKNPSLTKIVEPVKDTETKEKTEEKSSEKLPEAKEEKNDAPAANTTLRPPEPQLADGVETDESIAANASPTKRRVSQSLIPRRPASPNRKFSRSVSPGPELVPWLKERANKAEDDQPEKGDDKNEKMETSEAPSNDGKDDSKESKKEGSVGNPEKDRGEGGMNQKLDNFLVGKATLYDGKEAKDNSNDSEKSQVVGSNLKAAEEQKNGLKPQQGEGVAEQNNQNDNYDEVSGSNGNENSKDTNDREPLLKRLRENKVALLTSEAMTQLGCSGFSAKQKEVPSNEEMDTSVAGAEDESSEFQIAADSFLSMDDSPIPLDNYSYLKAETEEELFFEP